MKKNMDITARRLQIARTKRGFASCRDFALQHGFCARTYQRHERGSNKIDFPTMVSYCSALDISMLWLQTGEERYLDASFGNKTTGSKNT